MRLGEPIFKAQEVKVRVNAGKKVALTATAPGGCALALSIAARGWRALQCGFLSGVTTNLRNSSIFCHTTIVPIPERGAPRRRQRQGPGCHRILNAFPARRRLAPLPVHMEDAGIETQTSRGTPRTRQGLPRCGGGLFNAAKKNRVCRSLGGIVGLLLTLLHNP